MLTYSEIKDSELFSFFNFNEISRTIDEEENKVHVMLKPGGFIEFIDIYFIISGEGDFLEGSLSLDRNWVGDEKEINVFAKDIVKSFILELTPYSEREEISNIIQCIFKVKGSNDTVLSVDKIYDVNEIKDPVASSFVKALVGVEDEASLSLDCCDIKMENSTVGSRSRLGVFVIHRF